MIHCPNISKALPIETKNIGKTPEGIWKAQKKLVTLQRVLPIVGMIPAAIQVIVSLGEMIAGRLTNSKPLFKEGRILLIFGTLNILTAGFLFPIFGVIKARHASQSGYSPQRVQQ